MGASTLVDVQPGNLEPEKTDIVIVGCGPVGAMLANLLGLQGISTIALDREAEIYPLPRAVHFDDEVMRLLQTVGLADAMAPLVHVSPGMRFVNDSGCLLLDWSRPQDVGPQGWHVSYRFHQPELEAVLRAGLARWPDVTLRTSCEVFALEPGPDHVTVRYEDLASGTLRACQARYVVGCDGARSLVRRVIGADMEDMGFHERWLVVDALLRRPRPDLGDYSVQHCSAIRPATYVRGTGKRRRWEISVLPSETAAEVTEPNRVAQLLGRWVQPDDVSLERVALYTFHSAVALHWHSGRLLIAGDAAHLTPPFLGQGMCAGIRDVANLAWKLGAVLRGRQPGSLLDSYQSERASHVREYIKLAVRLGGLINTKAMQAALPDRTIGELEPVRMTSIHPLLGPGLEGGWIGPRGLVAPQPTLNDGTRLDDHVGYNFVALMRGGFRRALPKSLLSAMRDIDIVSAPDLSSALEDWLDEIGAEAVMVRPDRYVLGAARNVTEMQTLAAAAGASRE